MGCRQALAFSLAWADRTHSRSAPKLPALKVVLVPIGRDCSTKSTLINLHYEISNTTNGSSDVARIARRIPSKGKILVHKASRSGTKASQCSCTLHHSSLPTANTDTTVPPGQLLQGLRQANCKGPSYGDLHLSAFVLALGQAREG